jgi:hypothetical protein
VPADGISAASVENGDFGTSPFLGSAWTNDRLTIAAFCQHSKIATIGGCDPPAALCARVSYSAVGLDPLFARCSNTSAMEAKITPGGLFARSRTTIIKMWPMLSRVQLPSCL